MSAETVGYEAPSPRILSSYDEHTRGRRPETYYRCGYQVEGARPVMVDEFMRIGADAEHHARVAASDIRRQLESIGAPSEVFWWTQKWRTETTDTYDKPFLEVSA